ncbi:ribosomal-processing cysteine protease Prp [Limosilactobacillus sp. RRLNB_1_1]|uniref:Ribosomal processing cysteine protease Prp n=1 Tax=Limosilactobacillus albertensis TaxID=2759752 RepID=A0A7W3Y9A3_9LACO|nr:ribosomal-processing cysteine protease Prp [Limosilactobacillus albertensis]MBB1070272.1 ribosomal-processing cysteine protease Prp [Limosilactobacillus albertensis]MBB1124460.1 ribosomal-processing cysteine protease Prp [Limosilactobacillus albertensis]MCD7119129.1 ribosomal-processing cysteine protease Prp [Limosilactobacillus albertensis]MCD7122993.1 ribosomal-processing cysteine protease Prp [Limosilactobacillus albertensis]MCD7129337.1 ribosomal-processing cysteine protease Prp [Limosi
MIRVQFSLDSNQRITSFKMTGHADSGPYGQDIVCAAVSALSISTINGLEQVVHTKPDLNQDNVNGGFLEVTKLDLGHDSQILLRTLLNGLLDIQESYPKNIEVKMFN